MRIEHPSNDSPEPVPVFGSGTREQAAPLEPRARAELDAAPISPAAPSRSLQARLQDSMAKRGPATPRLDPNVVALFYEIDGLRRSDAAYALQFIAAAAGAGTTTMAREFCMAAGMEYRKPVLLLDCAAGEGLSIIGALA